MTGTTETSSSSIAGVIRIGRAVIVHKRQHFTGGAYLRAVDRSVRAQIGKTQTIRRTTHVLRRVETRRRYTSPGGLRLLLCNTNTETETQSESETGTLPRHGRHRRRIGIETLHVSSRITDVITAVVLIRPVRNRLLLQHLSQRLLRLVERIETQIIVIVLFSSSQRFRLCVP